MALRGADAARATIDTRAVAAGAGNDRPYLVSLLRRLGYSEGDIAAYLAGGELRKAGAAPAPAAPATRLADAAAPRDIEVEYTGPGLRDYRFVVPLEGEPVAEPAFQEVPLEPAAFEAEATGPSSLEEPPAEPGPEPTGFEPVEPESLTGFEEVEPEELAGFEPVEPEPEALAAAEAPAGPAPAPEEEPRPDAGAGGDEAEEPQVWAEEPPGFQQDGWRLYSKDEGEGQDARRIYFFSKEQPGDAVASEVPEGYEVAVNPETGRPFLRRMEDEEPEQAAIDSVGPASDATAEVRKRVRILRVRAANREEAQRKLERQGRHVLATMPVDVHTKVE